MPAAEKYDTQTAVATQHIGYMLIIYLELALDARYFAVVRLHIIVKLVAMICHDSAKFVAREPHIKPCTFFSL